MQYILNILQKKRMHYSCQIIKLSNFKRKNNFIINKKIPKDVNFIK